jgi:hypothetical protein
MIFVNMILCAGHFIMCGAWLDEILMSRSIGSRVPFQAYAWTIISFLVGLYFMIVIAGAGA